MSRMLVKNNVIFLRPIEFRGNCHFLKQIMEEGKWTQLLVSFWATRFQSSSVIYCTRTLILREICHNTKSARCVPPVEEAFPRPLGHPVKHREIYSLSYLGSYHLTLTEREGTERPRLKITKLKASEPQIVCNCVFVCVCVCGLILWRKDTQWIWGWREFYLPNKNLNGTNGSWQRVSC